MLGQLIQIIPIVLFAQSVIMTGIFFISAQLLPSLLSPFYASVGMFGRAAIASVFIFSISNFINGYAFARFNPALASPVMIACFVLAQVVFTILVIGVKPSLWIIPAGLMVLVGCVWVSILLSRQ